MLAETNISYNTLKSYIMDEVQHSEEFVFDRCLDFRHDLAALENSCHSRGLNG